MSPVSTQARTLSGLTLGGSPRPQFGASRTGLRTTRRQAVLKVKCTVDPLHIHALLRANAIACHPDGPPTMVGASQQADGALIQPLFDSPLFAEEDFIWTPLVYFDKPSIDEDEVPIVSSCLQTYTRECSMGVHEGLTMYIQVKPLFYGDHTKMCSRMGTTLV